MASKILAASVNIQSPFNSIRQVDGDGEFWSARDLMPLLGYPRWAEFEDSIERAKAAAKNAGNSLLEHFSGLTLKSAGRPKQDYRLSRLAAYLTAMNGDPRKPEVAAAQSYFAVKTHEAETVIPAQNERLRELELELKIREIDNTMVTLHGRETVLALRGYRDQVVETKIVVTEVVNPVTGCSAEILSADQLKQVVRQRTGQKLPSLKWFVERLRSEGRDDLLVPVTRSQTTEYLSPNWINEALDVVYGRDRQRLIGE